MGLERNSQYPYHLARLVATRLRAEQGHAPPEAVLSRLLETLYFASLNTDEGRRIVCTVNYVESDSPEAWPEGHVPAHRSMHVPFERPLPLDVRNLTKLARAADPAVSSLTVYSDRKGKLFIGGLVDQEPRHTERITLETGFEPPRPGLLQVMIDGIGNIAVYHRQILLGSLIQDTLVEACHNVLWEGPIHATLRAHLERCLAERAEPLPGPPDLLDRRWAEHELLLRWLNSLCRILVGIQHYRHGGGLLITTGESLQGVNIKYRLRYDRLRVALVGMLHAYYRCAAARAAGKSGPDDDTWPLPVALVRDLEERKSEVLGASGFVASLAGVDGVVIMDHSMAVYGFGVELRSDTELCEVHVAADAEATANRLRPVELTHFGTRHRAMMRYCDQTPGSLGFAVSQDGGIQAMTRVGRQLVMWENIDVQLAFKGEDRLAAEVPSPPLLRRLNVRLAD